MRIVINRYHCILAGIILFFVATNIVWIIKDQAPPMWDQSHYLDSSEVLYHTLTSRGIIPFLNAFRLTLQTKAPLITVLPIPFYILGGDNYTSALLINLFFIVVGSCYLYKLVTFIMERREALLSVLILNLFPLIFAMSREFLVEYGLMVFVIMWMYYFLKSEFFENSKDCYALGVVLGLGMLMKVTFVLYILPPTLFIFTGKIRELKGMPRNALRNILAMILVGFLIFGTWYISNIRSIINFALKSGYGSVAVNYGMGEVFSIKTILDYWTYNINYGISAYFFFLIVLLLLHKLILLVGTESFSNMNKGRFYFLLLWFSVPFLIFSFGVNKDYRYLSPIYPALAILMSSALVRLSSIRCGKVLLVMLMIFPVFNYLYISFSSKPIYLKIKDFEILNNQLVYAHPPVKEQWPNKRLIQLIHNDAVRTNNDSARTTLLFNHHYVNFMTLNYYSKIKNLNLGFDMIDIFSRETPEETAARIER
ncbi:MAG TPA: glycosyltransferase family 39 protein, partial [Syntrophales bacterium]|nr:glycosyltransferase family 39 protein [Syntrophales bacterium]